MAKIIKAHSQWDPPGKVVVECKDISLTKQSFKDECDVNRIVERFTKTGLLPEGRQDGIYGDFSAVPDFMNALETVRLAEEQFMSLDAVS